MSLAGVLPAARPRWGAVLTLGVALVFAVFAGLAVAVIGSFAAVALTSLMLFVAAMLMPVPLLFRLIVGIVFVVVGQLIYFARIDKAFWIPYLLCLVLYLRLLSPVTRGRAADAGAAMGLAKLMLVVLLLTAVATSLIHQVPPMQWLVAGKEYFFLLGILLCFAVGVLGTRDVDRLMRWLPWFLALQLPVVLYQRFYVVGQRAGDSAFDAVVGLFGGDPNGGGASGAMAIFSVFAAVVAIEGWRAGAWTGRRAGWTVLLALLPIVLAEVKFALLLLPFAAILVYGREVRRHPVRSVAAIVGGAVLAGGLLLAYQYQFTSDRTKEGRSVGDYAASIFERNFGSDQVNLRTLEVGRVAALVMWSRRNGWHDPAGLLIGHGIGATRIGNLVVGEIAKTYRIRIGRTSLAILLWEVGLLGTSAVIAGLLAASVAAFRQARRTDAAGHAWLLRASGAGLVLVLLGLPYNTDFVEVAQIQVLAWCLAGFVLAVARERPSLDRAS